MSGRLRAMFGRLFGSGVPQGFSGALASDERVLAVAETTGGQLIATRLGLWVPDGAGTRRIGWHLVSKARWRDGALAVTEAVEDGAAGDAVLLTELPVVRFPLSSPGMLPEAVHVRVTSSIRSRHYQELPGGGAWFVQRAVPGVDGVVLQVRPDPGTDPDALGALAATVAARMKSANDQL